MRSAILIHIAGLNIVTMQGPSIVVGIDYGTTYSG